jgi:hypothetical protein
VGVKIVKGKIEQGLCSDSCTTDPVRTCRSTASMSADWSEREVSHENHTLKARRSRRSSGATRVLAGSSLCSDRGQGMCYVKANYSGSIVQRKTRHVIVALCICNKQAGVSLLLGKNTLLPLPLNLPLLLMLQLLSLPRDCCRAGDSEAPLTSTDTATVQANTITTQLQLLLFR